MAFSSDSKFLLAQGGTPDWTLVCWLWEKGKQVGTMRTSNPSNTIPLHHCSFNPHDPSLACVSGQGIMKLLRCTDSAIKPIATAPMVSLPSSFAPLPSPSSSSSSGNGLASSGTAASLSLPPSTAAARREINLMCHVWVGEERLVVGTDAGELLLFDMGECRAVLPQSPGGGNGGNGGSIDAIVACGRGFICGGSSGIVHVYEKTEDKDYFKRVRSMKVDNGAVQAGSTGGMISFIIPCNCHQIKFHFYSCYKGIGY